jgi:hypothetical protein
MRAPTDFDIELFHERVRRFRSQQYVGTGDYSGMASLTGLHLPCRPLMAKVPGKPYVIDALNDVFMFYVHDGKLRYRFVYTLIRDF